MKDRLGVSSPQELVSLAKKACPISKPNAEMTIDEVRAVSRWLFERLPDTSWVDGEMVPGRAGIGLMLFVTMSEFPRFYEEFGLSQYN